MNQSCSPCGGNPPPNPCATQPQAKTCPTEYSHPALLALPERFRMRLLGVEHGKSSMSVFERQKSGFVMSDASGQFITTQPTFEGPHLVRYLYDESGRPIVKVGGGYQEDVPPAAEAMIVTDSCGKMWRWRGPTGGRSIVAWNGCHMVMEPHPDFKELADYQVAAADDCNAKDAVIVDRGGGSYVLGYRATPTRPPGEILTWAGMELTVPPGYLICDGEYYSPAVYPQLFTAIGYIHGRLGDDFRVPDLRGMFLRGTDFGAGNDPSAGGRTQAGPGGNSGDNPGSLQQDAFQGHHHSITGIAEIGENPGADEGVATDTAIAVAATLDVGNPSEGGHGPVRVATETRPKNISVIYLICTGCLKA